MGKLSRIGLAAHTGQRRMRRTVVPGHLMGLTWGRDALIANECSFGNGAGRIFEGILRHG